MKRFFVIAAAAMLTACMGNNVWSQDGQSGGTAGGAGSARVGQAAGQQGAGAPGVGANANVAAGRVGANTRFNSNFNGINPTPFFADPGVRSQLQLNNRQFNQLNAAYQRAYQRYNRGMSGPNANATPLQQRNVRTEANGNTAVNGIGTTTPPIGANVRTDVAAQQQLARLQQLQSQFYTDFNGSLDSTFTDPALRQRYNQLNWQFQGLGAFNDPNVQQQLNLTPQQRQQLATLEGQWRRELMNLQRSSRNSLTQDQFNDLRMGFMNQLNGVLTPEQQQLWTQLVGQSYDVPYSYYLPPAQVQGQAGVQQGTGGQTIVPRSGSTQNTQPPRAVR